METIYQQAVRARSERMGLIEAFEKLLQTAAKDRGARPEFVKVEKTYRSGKYMETEPEWAIYERGLMFARVNEIRAQKGLPPTTLAAVEKVERQAVGHSDYGHKFALYCTELALGEENPAP